MTESAYGVVLDYRPDVDRIYAWGPFPTADAAARFAEFATAEIDPAQVVPWAEAQAIPGVRALDPVAELLTWRTSVALPQGAENERLRAVITRAQNAVDGGDVAAVRAALADTCPRCKGSGIDPEHSSPGCTDPDRGAEPPNLEPCIACQYPLSIPTT